MFKLWKRFTDAQESIAQSDVMQRIARAQKNLGQNSMIKQLALAPKGIGRRLLTSIAIALCASVLALVAAKVPPLNSSVKNVNEALYDSFYRQRTPESRFTDRVVMITVDDGSVDRAVKFANQRWPWPRDTWASVVQWLNKCGAKVIVFDMLFEEPGDGDAAFAQALDDSKAPIVLAQRVRPHEESPFALHVKRMPTFGAVNLNSAVIRDYQPETESVPALAMQAVSKFEDHSLIPTWSKKPFLLHFYGPTRRPDGKFTFQQVPALDVFRASIDDPTALETIKPEMFKDRIVLIGVTANALWDVKSSPVADLYPGTEVQATAISNLLEKIYVIQLGMITTFIVALFGSIIAAAGAVVPRKARVKIVVTPLAIAAVFFVGYLSFVPGRNIYWLPLGMPLLACILATVSGLGWTYLVEDRQRRVLRRFLAQFVSPDVAHRLDEIGTVSLGGIRRELSFLFSDIAGFTTLSEQMSPDQLENFMNFYLSEMSGVVFAHNGTLDKYIGDAVMSFWNAPLDQPDHAVLACRTALGMHNRENEIQAELAALGAKDIHTRIGVHTGLANVGNYGSLQKLNYTVLGSNVNLASRLEGANKFYGSYILVAQPTVELVRDRFLFRQLDLLQVKGSERPMPVYELMAEGAGTPDQQKLAREFERALSAYHLKQWEEAERILIVLRANFPDDAPLETLLKRVHDFQLNPPPENWDGVYVAKDK